MPDPLPPPPPSSPFFPDAPLSHRGTQTTRRKRLAQPAGDRSAVPLERLLHNTPALRTPVPVSRSQFSCWLFCCCFTSLARRSPSPHKPAPPGYAYRRPAQLPRGQCAFCIFRGYAGLSGSLLLRHAASEAGTAEPGSSLGFGRVSRVGLGKRGCQHASD